MKNTLQPKVTVKVPEVKLRLDDLTYLRSLSGDAKFHCSLTYTQLNRLKVLGLVEEKEVLPSENTVNQVDIELEKISNEMMAALVSRDFKILSRSDFGFRIQKELNKKMPRNETVLTDVGRELLMKGEVVTKVSKLGCV